VTDRLLDRQTELVRYLTSGDAIFGIGRAPLPQGFDKRQLRLEAVFSYEKRLAKIGALLPSTIEILKHAAAPLLREFVETCPPASIGRLANARQLHHFLTARRRRLPPGAQHLADVASCELACAEVADRADNAEYPREEAEPTVPSGALRRGPSVVLLRCAYAIRGIFEDRTTAPVPAKRDTLLAIAIPPGSERPHVFELAPAVFELLSTLDNFVARAALGATPEVKRLMGELAAAGLIEEHR